MAVQEDTRSQAGAAPRHLLCTATSGYFTSLNHAWQEVLGWTEEELMSRPFTDFVHPRDRQRTLEVALQVGRPGYEVVGFENRYRGRDGRWHWLHWTARSDGHRWIAVATDISEEVEIGAAIARQAAAVAPAPQAAPPARAPGVDIGRTPARPAPVIAARIVYVLIVLVMLAAAIGLIRISGIVGFQESDPAWSEQQGPPSMHGPANQPGLPPGRGPLD
jgi:PAS domain S-box-containing protein